MLIDQQVHLSSQSKTDHYIFMYYANIDSSTTAVYFIGFHVKNRSINGLNQKKNEQQLLLITSWVVNLL